MNSGIYLIQNIFNGRKYVGSSRNLKHRRASHFSELRNNYHGNYKLQKEYNKYGETAFRWIILEKCEIDTLIQREQWWLDSLKPEYNILKKADNHACTETEKRAEARKIHAEKMRGRKASKETREKMSKSHIEFYSNLKNKEKFKLSKERKEYLSKINTGKNNPNWGTKRPKEFKKLISNLFSSIEYTYKNQDGTEVVFTNLTQFCKDCGLKYNIMRSLHQGRRKNPYRGWSFVSKKFIGYKKSR